MVGLSGGVDSAVAVCLLKDQGYEVAGITMCLGVAEHEPGKARCCGSREIEDARRVCRALDISHHVLDFAPELNRFVIEPFINEYRTGRTPNPCVECNRHIKFGALLEISLSMGFNLLATGHYAGIRNDNGSCSLITPKDTRKDQTYFLSGILRESLARVIFPLSGLTKDEVRDIARKRRLPVSSKAESQDICFIPESGTESFLKENIEALPGDIVDKQGEIIGRHRGIAFYTIGQRARLGLSRGMPLYVVGKDLPRNRIVAGERDQLLSAGLVADSVNILADSLPERAYAKIRYAHTPAACSISLKDGVMRVLFDEPQEAITPGQTVALYENGTVLASGIIREAVLPPHPS